MGELQSIKFVLSKYNYEHRLYQFLFQKVVLAAIPLG